MTQSQIASKKVRTLGCFKVVFCTFLVLAFGALGMVFQKQKGPLT